MFQPPWKAKVVPRVHVLFQTFQIGVVGPWIESDTESEQIPSKFALLENEPIICQDDLSRFVGSGARPKHHVLVPWHWDVLGHLAGLPIVDKIEPLSVLCTWIGPVAMFQLAGIINRNKIQTIHAVCHHHRQVGIDLEPILG